MEVQQKSDKLMKKSSTAFLTTVFPSCEKYLDEFLNALEKQNDKDFDVIVINDEFDNLEKYTKNYPSLNIIEVLSSKTPVQNRIKGLNFIQAEKYEYLFFGDSDDYFQNNRISVSKNLLQKNDIVVNDLVLFNETFQSNNIFNDIQFSKEDLIHENIFGLSNTAIKTNILNEIDLNPKSDIIAYDWYLFSLLVFKATKFEFTSKTKSFYRQYELNTIGLSFKLDEKSLEKSVQIKNLHLRALKKYYLENNKPKYYTIFENELNKLEELKVFLKTKKNKNNYIAVVNKNINEIFKAWYSQLISLEKYNSLNENRNK